MCENINEEIDAVNDDDEIFGENSETVHQEQNDFETHATAHTEDGEIDNGIDNDEDWSNTSGENQNGMADNNTTSSTSIDPSTFTAFDLEKLFYARCYPVMFDGKLHIRRGNHIEAISDKELESEILYYLGPEITQIGKPRLIKTIANLVRCRKQEYFPNVSNDRKYLAFNNGIFNSDDWAFLTTREVSFMGLEDLNCTFQFNFDFDTRLTYVVPYASMVNGYLMPPTGSSAQYRAEMISHQLNQIVNSIPTPEADKFFFDIAENNPAIVQRIYEMIGYILVPDNSAKAFFLLQGEGNSGKSVLGRFIEGYFPQGRVTPLDIRRLGGPHLPESLATSCLNLSMDLPEGKLSAGSMAVIKMITGGDLITHEVKFKEARPFRGNCKFLFSTNFPLSMNVHDQAFLDRIVCIPFNHSTPKDKQDKNLLAKLEYERANITAKALIYYYFLRQRGYVFSASDTIKVDVNYRMEPNETIEEFVGHRCVIDRNSSEFVSTDELYGAYLEYCRLAEITAVNTMTGFSQRLRAIYAPRITSGQKKIDGKHFNGYTGIKLLIEPIEFDDPPKK